MTASNLATVRMSFYTGVAIVAILNDRYWKRCISYE
ncbi:hypothetical protein V1282_006930 [Nitrobacteraceae bacterium AZCC 2146]